MGKDIAIEISTPGQKPVKTSLQGLKRAARNAPRVLKQIRNQAVIDAEKKLIDKAAAPVVEKERQGDMLNTKNVGGVAGERLTKYIERIERLEEEKAGLSDDIKDVFAEAKSAGFETKIMRQLIKLRKMDHQKRIEHEELLDLYKSAIGME